MSALGKSVLSLDETRLRQEVLASRRRAEETSDLDLSYQSLRPEHICFLASVLEMMGICVGKLNLYLNHLRAEGVAFLRDVSVLTLDLGSNGLGCKGVEELFRILSCPLFQSLRHLELNDNLLGPSCCGLIRDAFRHSECGEDPFPLETLTLSGNHLGEGVVSLFEPPVFCRLKHLDLNRNGIQDTGIVALSRWLESNPPLLELSLNSNAFGPQGVRHLASSLRRNSHLQVLQIAFNHIQGGLDSLCAAVASPSSRLCYLSIAGNEIGKSGAIHLRELLRSPHLVGLDLSKNQLGSAGAVILAEELSRDSALVHLALDDNGLADTGAIAIASAVRSSCLVNCHLSMNAISDSACVYLASALWSSRTLEVLLLRGNNITRSGANELVKAIEGRVIGAGERISAGEDSFVLPDFPFEKLDLRKNRLGPRDVGSVSQSFVRCSEKAKEGCFSSQLMIRLAHTDVTFSNCHRLLGDFEEDSPIS